MHRPTTRDELCEIVAGCPRLRVTGSRHSFNGIADSAELISLEALPQTVTVDPESMTVTISAGLTYAQLGESLRAEGLALHNLASLPHINVAGAISTGTHGSGDRSGNLATAVAALEIVTSTGETVMAARGQPDFDGMVVGLGSLGVITSLTLDVEPAYEVQQSVFLGLDWEALYGNFDEVTSAGDSVSLFTSWGSEIDQVWIKRRTEREPSEDPGNLFGAAPAAAQLHPIPGCDPVNCTTQLGIPGDWSDRLPHFRAGFIPSSGNEIQSEYIVPRRHAIDAIQATRALADYIRPVLQVSEIRTLAADSLWMSPEYQRDSVAIHFTWQPAPDAVGAALARVEVALAPFEARPHWGKLFLAEAPQVAPLYPRLADFARLVASLDPPGAFRNEWLETHLLGTGTGPSKIDALSRHLG